MKKQTGLQSKAVVYSFGVRWEEALKTGAVKVFFRKKRPVVKPDRVYFYIGVPVKKIAGHATIKKIESIDLKNAIEIRNDGSITIDELNQYIGRDGAVHAIWINKPTIYDDAPSLQELKEGAGFNPPQSFCNVSPELLALLLKVENEKETY